MTDYSGRLWPDVTSPLARRVLTEAFNMTPIDAEDYYYDVYSIMDRKHGSQPIDVELEDYRRRVRTGLEQSDLVARLLDPWWIEAAYDSLPEFWRRSSLLFRPRSVEGAVRHYSSHLDWYLGLAPDIRPGIVMPIVTGAVFAVFAAVIMLALLNSNRLGPSLIAPVLMGFIAVMSLLVSLYTSKFSKAPLKNQLVARAEFYLYLRNALRDNSDYETD